MKKILRILFYINLAFVPLSILNVPACRQVQSEIVSTESLTYKIEDFIDDSEPDSAIHYSNLGIKTLSTETDTTIFYFYSLKAEAYKMKNKLDKAEKTYKEAIKKSNKKSKSYDPNLFLADNFRGLATLLLKRRKDKEAIKYFEKAIELYIKYSDYYYIAEIRNNIGMFYLDNFEFQQSIKNFNDALKALNKVSKSSEKDELKATLKHNIGVSYTEIGRKDNHRDYFDEADIYLLEAKEIREGNQDSTYLGSTLISLADNQLLKDGNIKLAKKYLNDGEDIIIDGLKKSTFYLVKGRVAEAENRKVDALTYYEKSATLAEKDSGDIEKYDAYKAIIELDSLSDKAEYYWSEIGKIRGKGESIPDYLTTIIDFFSIPEKKPNLTTKEWLVTSLISLLISGLFMFFFIKKANTITDYGLANKYYYFLNIPASMSSAAFLFGAMQSYSTYSGPVLGGNLELAGPVVLFAGMMVFGYKYGKTENTFNFTIHLNSPTDIKGIKGEISMDVGHERKMEAITQKGSVDFKNIPMKYKSKEINLKLHAKGWLFKNGESSEIIKLSGESNRLELRRKK